MQILLHTRWLTQFGNICQRRWLTQSCTQIKVSITGLFVKVMQCLIDGNWILFIGFGIDK